LRRLRQTVDRRGCLYSVRTQEDVAQVLGLHRASISEIEAGRRKLTAAELVMLADWLRIPVTELLP